jgi:hypothetical protein
MAVEGIQMKRRGVGQAAVTVSILCLAWLLANAPASGQTVFPLKVAPSGRYLVDQTGAPFFVNGDTPWSITHNLTYAEAVQYMENRRAKGINALIVSVPDAFAPDGGASYPPDRQGQQPFVGGDITQPNEAYWQNVDNVMSKAEEMGFLVLYWPFYLGCCNDGYLALFQQNGVTKAREYGRFVGRRYGGRKNLIWVHGGDHDPDPVRDLVSAVKAGIQEVGPARLHATHWAPETDPYGPYGDAFTDLYTTYTYGPVANLVSRHYAHTPTKPVLLLETHYENDWAGKPAEEVRKYPYRAVLSGAAGHFFGNKPLWFCGYGWATALDGTGSRSMEWVGRLFNSRPWQRLAPAPSALVTSGGGDPLSDSGVQGARASDGSFAALFLPDRRTIQVALGQVSGTTVQAWWYGIATGTATSAGTFSASGTRGFTPPDAGGYVLVLDDASRAFPPPGTLPGPIGPPFGAFDTPANGATGVVGAAAVTGWALDDTQVTRVQIYRNPLAGEPTSPNGRVYIGDATFVAGARPDVAALYPAYPNANRAGWGYMLLTNMLPSQGNGSFTLYAYAYDDGGGSTLLGSKAITCANASATKPFGTLDTPAQGATVSGSAYAVFGWVLTPQPAVVPVTGSTLQVYVDGAPVGVPTYNLYRSDIAQLFPGYANSGGAVFHYVLNTTPLANGIHSIAVSATDNQGHTDGIGSRYFWVQN